MCAPARVPAPACLRFPRSPPRRSLSGARSRRCDVAVGTQAGGRRRVAPSRQLKGKKVVAKVVFAMVEFAMVVFAMDVISSGSRAEGKAGKPAKGPCADGGTDVEQGGGLRGLRLPHTAEGRRLGLLRVCGSDQRHSPQKMHLRAELRNEGPSLVKCRGRWYDGSEDDGDERGYRSNGKTGWKGGRARDHCGGRSEGGGRGEIGRITGGFAWPAGLGSGGLRG